MDGPRVTLCTNGFHGVRFRFQETFLYLGGLTSEVTVTNTVMSSPQQVGILSFFSSSIYCPELSRWIFLSPSGSHVCPPVVLLHCDRVHPLLNDGLCFLDVLLAGPQGRELSNYSGDDLLSSDQVPARVALGVTTLLAMSTTQASIQNSLPPVAYTKAIDVWSGVCVFFVFSALLEYALVNYASRWNIFVILEPQGFPYFYS